MWGENIYSSMIAAVIVLFWFLHSNTLSQTYKLDLTHRKITLLLFRTIIPYLKDCFGVTDHWPMHPQATLIGKKKRLTAQLTILLQKIRMNLVTYNDDFKTYEVAWKIRHISLHKTRWVTKPFNPKTKIAHLEKWATEISQKRRSSTKTTIHHPE